MGSSYFTASVNLVQPVCFNPDYTVSEPDLGAGLWFRTQFLSPDPPASSASGAGATSGDIDRLVRGIQAVLLGCVLGSGLAGFRLGLA